MMEEDGNHKRLRRRIEMVAEVVLSCVMPYIEDHKDRDAASLVCRRWYELDALTRKLVIVALCYTTIPDMLRRHMESLKLKGNPRAAMFNLIPEDWGDFVTPWVSAISLHFSFLRALHFRRMVVFDHDLRLVDTACGGRLLSLKIDKCINV